MRAGFVALIGAPNAGKSTLLNALIGTKLAIVTPKVQTTRTRLLGIRMAGQSQLLFVDTPGIFEPKKRLERAMVAAAWQNSADADIVVWVIDAKAGLTKAAEAIAVSLKKSERSVVVALNKIDLMPRDALLPLADKLRDLVQLERLFMISAEKGYGLPDMIDYLAGAVPEGHWFYPEDQLSDVAERMIAAEMTREALFLKLQQELPYETTVENERWEEREDGSVRIEQTILVQRDGQKGIVLGKGGRMIKSIGASARMEIQAFLGRDVHLFLFVKVAPGWSERRDFYDQAGLPFDV